MSSVLFSSARQHTYMLSVLYAIALPPVCPSVRHTGGSDKNPWRQCMHFVIILLCCWYNLSILDRDLGQPPQPSSVLMQAAEKYLPVFSAPQHLYRARYMLFICLSACPSVTRMDQSKTVEVRIMQLSPQIAQSL